MHCLRATVSLVDDDASVRRSLMRLFRSAGIDLATFASAEEFLKSGHLDSTKCIVLDVEMPGMSGAALHEICSARRPQLPVIMITAFEDPSAEARAKDAGALAFLHKPFDAAALVKLVRSVVGQGPAN